jgi:predicted patatin/cPLA2 family phospholipase
VTPDRGAAARDLVVYASGGGMRGIFGAGALLALTGLGVRDRLRAVYGISAGALNGAHFALDTMMKAMEWYLYHVLEHGLLARATAVALLRGEDMVDVNEAERVLADERLVDGDALSRSPFDVRFGAVERDSLEFHWLDARRPDAIRVLLASSTVFPFVHDGVAIDGTTYIDGGYREGICFRRLRRDHPGARLLLVLNDSEYESVVRRVTVSAALRLRDERLAAAWLDTFDRTPAEMAEALSNPHTLVLRPDERFAVHFATTDPAVLAHGFWLGYRAVLTQRERLQRFLAE